MDNTTGFYEMSLNRMKLYKKRKMEIYYIKSLDIAEKGKMIIINTLEGNVLVKADECNYIMIGKYNDVYPISKELFDSKYEDVMGNIDHSIRLVAQSYNWNIEKIKKCRLVKESYVYAIQVNRDFKVYVKHCDSVIKGKKGDYYARSYEDPENSYIIQQKIMENTYYLA